MISTGNDIVTLKATCKQRTNEKRFYSKILSDTEQELFRQQEFNAMTFQNFVWLLWSVKESVYKFLKRGIPDLVFSPTKIMVQHIQFPQYAYGIKFTGNQLENTDLCEEHFYNSIIFFDNIIFYARSVIHDEFISTVVNDNENFSKICWGVKSISDACYRNQSKEVRAFILNKLNSFFSNDKLRIEKHAAGYPFLLKEEKQMNIPVSLAHHDHFIAYSFIILT